MAAQSWKTHTRENIVRMQEIFALHGDLNLEEKLSLYRLAYDLAIKTATIDDSSATRFWGVFHNCLRIVVLGCSDVDVPHLEDGHLFQE